MGHKLFYTDVDVSEAQYRAQKHLLLSYRYSDQDDALGKARQILLYGGVPWEIESDDGTIIGRYEIAKIIRDRGDSLAGRPKVY